MGTTRTLRRAASIFAVLAATMAMVASAAVANPPDAGFIQFSGDAVIGPEFTQTQNPRQQCEDPDKEYGLDFPAPIGTSDNGKLLNNGHTRCWGFDSFVCQGATVSEGLDDNCHIEADGLVNGSCGMSEGRDGKGEAVLNGNDYYLFDIGWPLSAGGFLPITGRWTDNEPDAKDKVKKGTLAGLVRATGTNGAGQEFWEACQDPKGATQFRVHGLVVLLTN